tara:strand:+ start:1247 stop:2062 length:816 start_codon:yes stop_codon:yes gene_type:complete
MSKVIAAQIKNILKTDGFFPHKGNAKGNTVIYSRKHPTAKFVRVVVNSGIDAKSGKFTAQPTVKLCYINRNKGWREITTETFTDPKRLASTITAQEAAEKFVKSCKFCKAKKFTAKTGNTVCANACWTAWGGKKKAASTKKKKSQKVVAQARPQMVTPKSKRNYPLNKSSEKKSQKSSEKKSQKIVVEILPGDLVTVEELEFDKVITDFTGSILGVVMKVDQHGRVTTNWTADTTDLPDWDRPSLDHYKQGRRRLYRFKVLSRKSEWVNVA